MSVCDYINNFDFEKYNSDKLESSLEREKSLYRLSFERTMHHLTREFDLISLTEGDDLPESYQNEHLGTCCIVFKGDFKDMAFIEDYLNSRNS